MITYWLPALLPIYLTVAGIVTLEVLRDIDRQVPPGKARLAWYALFITPPAVLFYYLFDWLILN